MNSPIREVLIEVLFGLLIRNLKELGIEEEEDEGEEPRHDIRFLEGIDFLGAIDMKINRERKEKNTTKDKAQERRKHNA